MCRGDVLWPPPPPIDRGPGDDGTPPGKTEVGDDANWRVSEVGERIIGLLVPVTDEVRRTGGGGFERAVADDVDAEH